MARVSFTLRKPAPDHGSYARYESTLYDTAASAGNSASAGTWTYNADRDIDISLRSDGYLLPPVEFADSFLEAAAVAYGVVEVNWGAPLSTSIGAAPVATQTVLVYSPYGPAPTISSGTVLSESPNEFSIIHNSLTGGQWAYYTLFIKYESTTGVYYERAAYVEILIPENYGSTLLLWNRIPEYYRSQDIELGSYVDPNSEYAVRELGVTPPGNIVGPLFKFLSVFGFEMDKIRTLIDYLMVSKDPSTANVESLNALTQTMGVYLNTGVINANRIRAVMDSIGYLRRSKGTAEGVLQYARAVSNCEVEFDQTSKTIKFFSQRVNYITDPLDATGMLTARPAHESEAQLPLFNMGSYDPTTYVSGTESTYPDPLNQEYVPGMFWTAASASVFEGIPVDVGDYIVAYHDTDDNIIFGVSGYTFDADNYAAYDTYALTTLGYTPSSGSDSTYVPNGTGASVGITHALIHIDCPVPVRQGDAVYFSVHNPYGTEALTWARVVDETGNVLGTSTGTTRADGFKAAEIPISSDLTDPINWTIGFVELLVDLEAVPITGYLLQNILIERNHLGKYFDGNTISGGWLTDFAGSTVSDYRWVGGVAKEYTAISMYTEQYQQTRAIAPTAVRNALPVTVADAYTIDVTDAIPGWDAIVAYLVP